VKPGLLIRTRKGVAIRHVSKSHRKEANWFKKSLSGLKLQEATYLDLTFVRDARLQQRGRGLFGK
jgi:hypothetical protein